MKFFIHVFLVILILSCGPGQAERRLLEAVENNDTSLAESLVKSGADVNYVYKPGTTALIRAVSLENYDIARILLASGADFSYEPENGISAFAIALDNGDRETVMDLLKTVPENNRSSQEIILLYMLENNKADDSIQNTGTAAAAGEPGDATDNYEILDRKIDSLDKKINSVVESKAVEEFLLREYLSGKKTEAAAEAETGHSPIVEDRGAETGRKNERLLKLSDLIGDE